MRSGNYRVRPDGKTERVPDETDISEIRKGIAGVQNEIHNTINDANNQTRGNDRHMRQVERDRDELKRGDLLTKQNLDLKYARPLYAEIDSAVDVHACIKFAPRPQPYAPNSDGKITIPVHNVFCRCDEADCALTIPPKPDSGRPAPIYAKRIARQSVSAGLRGQLIYQEGQHPMGPKSPENWLFVHDSSVTQAQIDDVTQVKAESRAGVVKSVNSPGDGTVYVLLKCDDGGEERIQMLATDAPAIGARGFVTYIDGNPVFYPE